MTFNFRGCLAIYKQPCCVARISGSSGHIKSVRESKSSLAISKHAVFSPLNFLSRSPLYRYLSDTLLTRSSSMMFYHSVFTLPHSSISFTYSDWIKSNPFDFSAPVILSLYQISYRLLITCSSSPNLAHFCLFSTHYWKAFHQLYRSGPRLCLSPAGSV